MRITILGQGAIGLLWYAKLKQIGADVDLISSPRISNPPANMHLLGFTKQLAEYPLNLTSLDNLKDTDVLLCCLKAYNILPALASYVPKTPENTKIVLCHNGMMALSELKQLGVYRDIYTLLTSHASKRTGDFAITHTGEGTSQLGSVFGSELAKIGALLKQLNTAMPPVTWHENILEMQWLKLAVNCVINPITALENIDNGEILNLKYKEVIVQLCQEISQVASTQGVQISVGSLLELVYQVAENTAANCSSMRADVLNQRKTEIEHINGFVHNLGQNHLIETSKNSLLYQAIRKQEMRYGR